MLLKKNLIVKGTKFSKIEDLEDKKCTLCKMSEICWYKDRELWEKCSLTNLFAKHSRFSYVILCF